MVAFFFLCWSQNGDSQILIMTKMILMDPHCVVVSHWAMEIAEAQAV